jgi:hypothetical protein
MGKRYQNDNTDEELRALIMFRPKCSIPPCTKREVKIPHGVLPEAAKASFNPG